jgi:hypothetical protein
MYSKIITRDLRLMASRLYRMAVTQPQVICRHYILPRIRRRPPGLNIPYMKGNEMKGKQTLNNRTAYVLLRNNESRYQWVPLRVKFRRIWHKGKLHLHMAVIRRR